MAASRLTRFQGDTSGEVDRDRRHVLRSARPDRSMNDSVDHANEAEHAVLLLQHPLAEKGRCNIRPPRWSLGWGGAYLGHASTDWLRRIGSRYQKPVLSWRKRPG